MKIWKIPNIEEAMINFFIKWEIFPEKCKDTDGCCLLLYVSDGTAVASIQRFHIENWFTNICCIALHLFNTQNDKHKVAAGKQKGGLFDCAHLVMFTPLLKCWLFLKKLKTNLPYLMLGKKILYFTLLLSYS